VQEAYTGAQFYGCDKAAVVCPGEFTRGAKELAQSTGVLLWDGKKLSHMMKISGRRPKHRA
jgi:HJR/Mrr/RecB family endonuclease